MARQVELTAELIELHERLRSEGVPIAEACKRAGHSVAVWYGWKERADAGENGLLAEFGQRVLPYTMRGSPQVKASTADWRNIDYFADWASGLTLDSGEHWKPEQWQLDPVEDLLSNLYQAIWLVVPEGNGKTTLTAGVVLYLLEHELTPEIPIGSATVTQADTLFRQIEGFIIRSEKLKDYKLAPGVRRIDCRLTHGHTRVYPHNERSGDGVIPSAAVLDEGHLHPDMRLYRIWKGKYRKRRGPVIVISTAGEPESEFEELRTKLIKDANEVHKDGAHIRAVYRGTVLHDWAVRNRGQSGDMKVVAAANPLEAITAEELAEKRAEPEMTEEHWLRRTCNIASRAEGQAILPEQWDKLAEPNLEPDRSRKVLGWVDLGFTIDTTAMGVIVWEGPERRVITAVNILEPPVNEADIVEGLLDLQEEFLPEAIVYDPNAGGRQMAQLLEKGEHPRQRERNVGSMTFIEHPQDNSWMVRAATRFDEALRNGWLVHDGDPGLRAHAQNVVKKSVGGEKWRYDRPTNAQGGGRRKFPNDALIGAVMGHSIALDLFGQKASNSVAFL